VSTHHTTSQRRQLAAQTTQHVTVNIRLQLTDSVSLRTRHRCHPSHFWCRAPSFGPSVPRAAIIFAPESQFSRFFNVTFNCTVKSLRNGILLSKTGDLQTRIKKKHFCISVEGTQSPRPHSSGDGNPTHTLPHSVSIPMSPVLRLTHFHKCSRWQP